ncbi:hypothetical protein SEA_EMMA1919_158 [Streptomyces phage Emma1919]|uniref:Uncharacterized protein n=1 Tax=Streptomyces phage Gilson TaxID=2488789 RepID=A0A3Q9R4W7_9CAUD|nr:hypothetical protein HWB98_gp118 [Streptomyces phage Gilson]AZU97211.1 hypothetical protein SEA_GILSON_157 [Streptomyces phage Gilson]URQ04748.1 hypothetical protein SEA_EMMA1919_158 [Streptomyces phage Emma1919]
MGYTRVRKGDNVFVQKGPDKGKKLKVTEEGKGMNRDYIKLSNGEWYHQDMVSGTGM